MFKLKKTILLILALCVHTFLTAQETVGDSTKTGEGFMRSEAKIYVVAAVVITILTGLIIYVARLDRKISKLEKETKL
jgi:hypothetical protein